MIIERGELRPSHRDGVSDLEQWANDAKDYAEEHGASLDEAREMFVSVDAVDSYDDDELADTWTDLIESEKDNMSWLNASYTDYIPDGLDTDLRVRDNTYGVIEIDYDNDELPGGIKEFEPVTSFVLDVQEFVENTQSGELEIRMEVIPDSGEESFSVTVSPRVFNDPRSFREEVCIGLTTTFSGTPDDLNELRQVVGQQAAEHVQGHTTVGLHDGVMVTPEGVIGGSCWTDFRNSHTYLDTGQNINDKWALDVDGSDGEFDFHNVAEVLELIVESRSDTERFVPALGWWMASLVAPSIRAWEGELPSVMVSGDTGVGKSSFLQTLSKLTGLNGSPGSAKDTSFALIKGMASTNNVPVWFDEYKPSDMRAYQVDNLQDLLKKNTRCGGETRGNADQTTTNYRLTAPVIFSGEQSIQGSAEERRMIRTQLTKPEGTNKAYARLLGGSYTEHGQVTYSDGADFEDAATALWQWIVDNPPCTTNEAWQDAQSAVYTVLEEHNIAGVDDLELTALTMIQFGMNMYFKLGAKFNADLCVGENDVEDALVYIGSKMGQESRTSHLDEFVSLTSTLVRKGRLVEDEEYRVMDSGEVRLRIDDVHHELSRYVKDYDLDSYDLLNSPRDYKNRLRDAFDDDDHYATQKATPDHVIGNSYCFDAHDAADQVDGFELGAFVEESDWD
ncbi:hypothetical protein SAMN05443636_2319 [Halobaculum gomorrense]|uniref:DUF927 domain-containing protein n=2 Tax=Halobaculum gomorrense TaxID=43928 RepID=A0A1M5S308_9EURY|nr:hypothetical protein SAMN05443636_2319 [Halobaculum gomorrense]